MSDILIRDIPDDVLASLDAIAARMGLSRTEYIRRRLAQDARTAGVTVAGADLRRFASDAAGLGDPDLMGEAWEWVSNGGYRRSRRDLRVDEQ